ncbi:hypothetical protein RB2150_11476 [Rhodobacteraceae bacterium HTCC2150]|nr:hypothetical protein RB2150_11476 [Rhodobacteraceae bacterium HTCC2150]
MLVELFLEQALTQGARVWHCKVLVKAFDAMDITHGAFTTM